MNWFALVMEHTWHLISEASPYLLIGLVIAGLLKSLVSEERIKTWLGTPGFLSIFRASVIGTPLPLCSCGVLPVAQGMLKQGASRSATMTFLVSTPENGIDSILMSVGLLGLPYALLRLFCGWLVSVITGTVDYLLEPPSSKVSDNEHSCCKNHCHDEPHHQTDNPSIIQGIRFAFTDLLRDLAPSLWLGFVLGGIISALIPQSLFETWFSGGWTGMILVLAVAIPLYVCATSSTPLALSFISSGMSPGTALVFLLAGPAVNTASLVVMKKMFGLKAVVRYSLSIAVSALALGIITDIYFHDILLNNLPRLAQATDTALWEKTETLCALLLFFFSILACKPKPQKIY